MSLKELNAVSMPIGDPNDLTLRALDTLRRAKVLVVEDYGVSKKILDYHKIPIKDKEVFLLNEHNEKKEGKSLAETLLSREEVCLLSDAGSPLVGDPGNVFLSSIVKWGVDIVYHPGASSIIGALIVAGISLETFYYAGFLPRKEKERRSALRKLSFLETLLIIMETPYRLIPLLQSAKHILGENRRITLCFSITTQEQKVFRGTIKEATHLFASTKKPFVLLIDNTTSPRFSTGRRGS